MTEQMRAQPEGHGEPPRKERRALLLQGPVGPFFARLQEALDAEGWRTVRVLFNGGDCHFHGKGKDLRFSERLSEWPQWLDGFLEHFQPEVIFMFGDQRPVHVAASEVARRRGVAVISFEEGYIRPHFITMEALGNNANSPLRLWQPEWPEVEREPPRLISAKVFNTTAVMATRYFIAMHLDIFRFPYYEHHRDRGLVSETLFWFRNAYRKWSRRFDNLQQVQTIVETLDDRYFIVALQVHDDLQLRCHGNGWTLEKLIETSIASFAESGLPQDHLVIKGHPLDRGHSSSREFVRKISAIYGISDRVHYLDDGSLGLLARHSRGMLTVNSTSAMSSFTHAKPVFALGNSFYEDFTANGANRSLEALSRFWVSAPPFDKARWEAFRAFMGATSQVNGNFYHEAEFGFTCANIIARMPALIAQARDIVKREA